MPAGASLDWDLEVPSTAKLTDLSITIPFGLSEGELLCTRETRPIQTSGSLLPSDLQDTGTKVSFYERPGTHIGSLFVYWPK